MRRAAVPLLVIALVVAAVVRGQSHPTARAIGLYVLVGVVALIALLGAIRLLQLRAEKRRIPAAVAHKREAE